MPVDHVRVRDPQPPVLLLRLAHRTCADSPDIHRAADKIGIKEAANLAGIHYTTVYDWKGQLEARGKDGFLAYRSPAPGKGVKRITEGQEKGVIDTRERYPGS